MNYFEKLAAHLKERPTYDEEVTKELSRICRVGNTSAQGILQILEVVEAGHDRIDQGMRGLNWTDNAWDDQMVEDRAAAFDRVFYPGEVGGAIAQPSQLEI